MDKATQNSRILHLDSLPREDFQRIYEDSMRGKVRCSCCGEEVRLYLGIRLNPQFIHKSNKSSDQCEEYVNSIQTNKSILKQDEPSIEKNGFKLPKGRSIQSATAVEPTKWKSIAMINDIPPFSQPILSTKRIESYNTPLDSLQWQAVTTIEGPLLILAGAGSGKTRVLTSRTAYLIKEKMIDPKTIMLVTFTTKAAKEMKQRLTKNGGLSPKEITSIVSGTFHSIFYKIVTFHEPHRWHSSRLLKWEWQREQIIKEAAKQLNIDEKEFAFDQALQQIGYWKNTLTFPQQVKPKDPWEERVHYMYTFYEQEKQKRGLFDFDDMLIGCYKLFCSDSTILKSYQERFDYFLVDEFQDINKVQYEIMKMLSAKSKNICVVGDDDQSIYAFRGSDPTFILEFEQDFPHAKVVTLSQNYRSSHSIVVSANKMIARNKQRRDKTMNAGFDNGFKPTFFFPYEEEEEATMIVTDIKERIEKGAKPSDFAILYRTHSASRAIFERLSHSSLPFVIDQDTESFYNRRMVKSLLAYMRLSLNPNHVEAISDILVSLFLKQSVLNDLKAFSILEDCSLVEALKHIKDIHAFQQKKLKKVVPLFSLLKGKTPMLAIEMIENEMGFGEFIKKRGNEGNVIEKGSDDIRDLKVVAKKFETIEELLDHVDHMNAMTKEMKQMSKDFQHAVQLTTIHRSKGLEYKHVYIIGAVDGSIPHDYALDSYRNGDESSLEEERRLMYVAMTRAQESLFISIPEMRRGKKAYPSRLLKTFL